MNKLSELHSEHKKMIIADFNNSYNRDIEHGEELDKAMNVNGKGEEK